MANSDIDTLIKGIGAQLITMRKLYQKALEYGRSDHPMRRLYGFFDPATYGPEGLTPEAYAHFLPGIWLGFEKDKDVHLTLAAVISSMSAPAENGDVCDVEINRTGEDAPQWLTLEMEVPLQYLRTSQQLSISLFGSVRGEDSDAALTDTSMHLNLFVHDTSNVRHQPLTAPFRPALGTDHGQARCDAKVELSQDIRIDEARPATLAVFFPTAARKIAISDIYLDFD